jgi:drug/metabolite transporter (DMT)-like permease
MTEGTPLSPTRPGRAAIAVALAIVYVVWGSTYFAIRIGLRDFPPLLFAGTRFVVAGALLYALLRVRGQPAPTGKGWGAALRVGVLLLTFGNAGVVVAEQRLASGVVATIVASVPLWAALFSSIAGHRPRPRELAGMALGVLSVAVLQADGGLRGEPVYAAVVVCATASWALGSIWSRSLPMPPGLMGSAASMLAGGGVLLVLAALRGEWPVHAPSLGGLGALAYLIVMGSMVGYSAYAWLLRSVPPALATSYAYVNPVIALALGALFLGERFGKIVGVATVGILGGVALVSLPVGRPSAPAVGGAVKDAP